MSPLLCRGDTKSTVAELYLVYGFLTKEITFQLLTQAHSNKQSKLVQYLILMNFQQNKDQEIFIHSICYSTVQKVLLILFPLKSSMFTSHYPVIISIFNLITWCRIFFVIYGNWSHDRDIRQLITWYYEYHLDELLFV